MNNKYDILIIGAGPGGLYASYYAHLKGLSCFLIDGTNILGGQPITLYSQKTIYDFPTYSSIKGYQIANLFIDQFLSTKTLYSLNTKLENFVWNKSNNCYDITFDNKQKIQACSIIVAIGAGIISPNRIETKFDKAIHYSVQSFATYENKNVIMLGGGDAAIDWVNEIANNCKTKSLTIIHRKKEFRASGKLVDNIIANKKIKILFNKNVEIIDNNNLIVVDNITNLKEQLNFDYLIVQYGSKVNLEANKILTNFKLNEHNKIVVNDLLQTNHNNIYAIGSIAAGIKPNLISIVTSDAIKVVDNILNEKRKYE